VQKIYRLLAIAVLTYRIVAFITYSYHMIPKLRPDLCNTLFQRVIVSCQCLYHLQWIELISWQSVYNRFTESWFYTPDSNPVLAMTRRFADMVSCWLLEYIKIQDWVKLYKLTDLWRRIKAHHCHIVTSLQIKDCIKDISMHRRLKTWKSDRMRSVQSESQIKSENKVLNALIEKEAPKLQPTTLRWYIKSLFIK